MLWIVCSEQAIAKKNLHASQGSFADEATGLVDEDLLHISRIVDEDDVLAHEAIVRDGTEGAFHVLEELNGMTDLGPGSVEMKEERTTQARRKNPLAATSCSYAVGSEGGVVFDDYFL